MVSKELAIYSIDTFCVFASFVPSSLSGGDVTGRILDKVVIVCASLALFRRFAPPPEDRETANTGEL
jgi:hypothetical protein